MATTSQRIKEALDIRGMKQSDLVEKTGIGKSSISTYISGEYSPKQKNLYKIAKALHVNEAWLMGLDVPMECEDSLKDIIYQLLLKTGLSLEDVAAKANVPLKWLQDIDSFIPGEMESMIAEGRELDWDDTIGEYTSYKWITRVAEVLGIQGSILRAALAKQEIPLPDDIPQITAQEAFKDSPTPLEKANHSKNEFPPEIRAAARDMMDLSPEDQKTALDMIKFLSHKGKEAKKE